MFAPDPLKGCDHVEQVLEQLEPYIIAQAQWVAWMVEYLHDGRVDWEDLAQAARVCIWRQMYNHPETPVRLLLTIGRLRMYGEPQRGKSVDRPHPGKRKQPYVRTELIDAANIPLDRLASTLTDQEEQTLLENALAQARLTQDEHGEHLLLLALRRLAKATGNDSLYTDVQKQWRDWWQARRTP